MNRWLGTLLVAIVLPSSTVLADNWGPWEIKQDKVNYVLNRMEPPPSGNSPGPLQLAVRMFQKYISPVDGPRCPMYPTCSSYSLQALHQHGPLLGVFLTVDRLYREGDPHEHKQPIDKWGYIRFNDPLNHNDFWLKIPQQH